MKKAEILINHLVYLGHSILKLSKKTNVWVFVWLCKTKVWWKCKIMERCYMDTDKVITHIKTDTVEDV